MGFNKEEIDKGHRAETPSGFTIGELLAASCHFEEVRTERRRWPHRQRLQLVRKKGRLPTKTK